MKSELVLLVVLNALVYCKNCSRESITTVSGTHVHEERICSGDLIFYEDFDKFDLKVWNHEETLAGGGNWEFQWYTNNRSNSFVENGTLFLKPTLLSDDHGEEFLYTGTLDVNGDSPVNTCTNSKWFGCLRTGTRQRIINPVKSAKIRSVDSFAFRYGKLEVRAKLPRGDWLWPAIWLMPRYNQYGPHPSSGEIDLMEGRGNVNLTDERGFDIGVNQFSSTLHWGPDWSKNLYPLTHYERRDPKGFHSDFHLYQLNWTNEKITFSIDNERFGEIAPPEGGFWEYGGLGNTTYHNPWKGAGKMAPFDQEFYIIMNLAVGGISFFPDSDKNPEKKPWLNNSTRAMSEFWEGKKQWLPTWDFKGNESTLQIDYVKVWAL